LFKNLKIEIYKSQIPFLHIPVCNLSPILKEERRSRVGENVVLRRDFYLGTSKYHEDGEVRELRRFLICTVHQILLKWVGMAQYVAPMGTAGPFLGLNRGRGVTLTTHPI
jgi:hypothetical protein